MCTDQCTPNEAQGEDEKINANAKLMTECRVLMTECWVLRNDRGTSLSTSAVQVPRRYRRSTYLYRCIGVSERSVVRLAGSHARSFVCAPEAVRAETVSTAQSKTALDEDEGGGANSAG